MLHGKLFLFEGKSENKYPIIELLFTDDTGLVLTDFQGIAAPTLNPEAKDAPDALSAGAGADYLEGPYWLKRKPMLKPYCWIRRSSAV
jgi:formamidopyrimidine-DNA glycosylase